jgi:hypothetical protein
MIVLLEAGFSGFRKRLVVTTAAENRKQENNKRTNMALSNVRM